MFGWIGDAVSGFFGGAGDVVSTGAEFLEEPTSSLFGSGDVNSFLKSDLFGSAVKAGVSTLGGGGGGSGSRGSGVVSRDIGGEMPDPSAGGDAEGLPGPKPVDAQSIHAEWQHRMRAIMEG